jgi:hypothetical protein
MHRLLQNYAENDESCQNLYALSRLLGQSENQNESFFFLWIPVLEAQMRRNLWHINCMLGNVSVRSPKNTESDFPRAQPCWMYKGVFIVSQRITTRVK